MKHCPYRIKGILTYCFGFYVFRLNEVFFFHVGKDIFFEFCFRLESV